MRIQVRVTSVEVQPCDTSGALLIAEVSDWKELWRELLMQSTEEDLRLMVGDEMFEDDVARSKAAAEKALRRCGFDSNGLRLREPDA